MQSALSEFTVRRPRHREVKPRGLSKPKPPSKDLTPREQQLAWLISGGLSNQQIAVRLGLSADTVKVYVSKVLGKLRVSSRRHIALAFREYLEAENGLAGEVFMSGAEGAD